MLGSLRKPCEDGRHGPSPESRTREEDGEGGSEGGSVGGRGVKEEGGVAL